MVIRIRRPILALFLVLAIMTLVNIAQFSLFPVIKSAVSSQMGRKIPVYSVDVPDKRVSVTLDATWGAKQTADLLAVLDKHGVKATFFLAGYWIEEYPDHVRMIASKGHEIGNHTYSHPHLNSLDIESIKKELNRCSDMIENLTGTRPTLFRPPFGEYSNKVVTAAEKCGYKSIQWSIDSLDWQELGKEPMVKRVTESLHPGAIILFHNNGKYTAEALPEIIAFVKEQSYKVVPVSELLYKENYYIDSNTGAQIQMPLQD